MLVVLLHILLACSGTVDDSDTARPTDTGGDTDTDTDTDTATGVETDVLVIGSGPAGLAAAWEIQDAGARVIVLERKDSAGGAGLYAGNFFGVATSWQAVLGIEDTVEEARADWALFTGGDAEDPWVTRLLEQSAETLAWLVYEFGNEVRDVYQDPSAGVNPRMHLVSHPDHGPAVVSLVEAVSDVVWVNTQAEHLRIEDDRVVGVEATDMLTGELFSIEAGATIIATGGFARDLEAVQADRQDLAGLTVLFEADHVSDGGGRDLLEEAGAAVHNPGNYGVYVHSIPDPREDFEGEALVVPGTTRSLIVTLDAERVVNEDETRSFHLSHRLQDFPEGRLLALFPAAVVDSEPIMPPAYNWEERGVEEVLALEELIAEGVAWRYEDAATLAEDWGMDVAALEATLDAYEVMVATGQDTAFNKKPQDLVSFGGDPITLFELSSGAAKAFGGAELDLSARVLDEEGDPIAGLYAAGEVAGMLGTAAVGEGFSGSVTACFMTGRIAGQSAAAEVLAR